MQNKEISERGLSRLRLSSSGFPLGQRLFRSFQLRTSSRHADPLAAGVEWRPVCAHPPHSTTHTTNDCAGTRSDLEAQMSSGQVHGRRDSGGDWRGEALGSDPVWEPQGGNILWRKNGKHGDGDCGLRPDHLGVDSGGVHFAHGLLEGVLRGRDGHHHSHLLVQPVEDVRDRFHRRVQLQGLPFHAGSGWWVQGGSPSGGRGVEHLVF